jgi:hypothetical protein
MATISNVSLLVTNLNNTTVTLTVKYTLTPNTLEKLAGSVFSENIQLIGDDPGVAGDLVITTFTGDAFAVSNGTPTVSRMRTKNVLKSTMNEDPEFASNGGEVTDEVFARITLAYAANAPIPPALPSPAVTNTVTGAWK